MDQSPPGFTLLDSKSGREFCAGMRDGFACGCARRWIYVVDFAAKGSVCLCIRAKMVEGKERENKEGRRKENARDGNTGNNEDKDDYDNDNNDKRKRKPEN